MAKAVFPPESSGCSKHPLLTTQETTLYMDIITKWSVNIKIRLTIFFVTKGGKALYSQPKQDLELIVAQIIKSLLKNSLNLKKGKNTRQFTYVLNQISYDYTVEVTNRLKRLDLIDTVPE